MLSIATSGDGRTGVLPAARDRRPEALLVAGLLVAAIALRAPGLDPSSLWLDDTWIALVHKVDELPLVMRMGVTAPGFSLVLKAMFSTFGFSHLAAQALPFLAAIAAPSLVYLLARRWGTSRSAAALAGVLLLLSPIHVTYSTNVKQYTLDVILVLLLVWLSWRATRRPATERQDALAVLSLIGLLSIFFSASVTPVAVVAVAVPALPGLRRSEWRYARWPAVLAVFTLAWAINLRGWISTGLTGFWDERTEDGMAGLLVGYGRLLRSFTGSPWLGAAVLLLGLLGLRRVDWSLRALLLGPLAVAGVASFVGVPLGTGRTDMYLYGLLAIAAGLGVDAFLTGQRWRWAVVLVTVVVMATPLPRTGYATEDGGMIQDTRPLIEQASELLGPDDTLLTLGSYHATTLYGPWDVEIRHSERSTQGWWATILDDRVQNLPWARTPTELVELFPTVTSDHAILIWTQLPSDVLRETDRQLRQRGFQLRQTVETDGAELRSYRCMRTGGCGLDDTSSVSPLLGQARG